ncbi:GLPGLI family protein [Porphyromonas levii]|nr:GLPGLI family protein [Porphyromonas levii]TFH95368.1 GLPGLI family protein [Porphyromonas levii]
MNTKNISVFIVSLLSIFLLSSFKIENNKHSSIIDQANLKILYRFEMKKNPFGGISIMKDTTVFLHGDVFSLSYTQSAYYSDSLINTPNGGKIKFRMMERGLNENNPYLFLEPHTLPDYTYVDHDQKLIINYDSERFYVPVLYREPIEDVKWTLRNYDSRVIAGYQVYKAICDFRGRRYEAWYTPEIPVEVGPWKFHGLPGVILEVYDEDKNFFWTAFSVEYSPQKPIESIRWIKFSETPFTIVDRKDYLRDVRSYISGEDINNNKTLQQIISSGVRTRYRQRPHKEIKYDFIELDYKQENNIETQGSRESAELLDDNFSFDSIKGVRRKDYLLLQYEYCSMKDTIDLIYYRPDVQMVEVHDNQSVTYSLRTYQMKEEFGSEEGKKKWQGLFDQGVESVKAGVLPMKDFMNRLPRLGQQDIIKINLETGAMLVYDNIGTEQYKYDDLINIKWHLLDKQKTILGYDCQLAITNFRGRKWFAWYSIDLPIGAGPWKLFGLPGVIFEAYDEKKHYHYTLKGLEQKQPLLDYTILLSPNATQIDRIKFINSHQVYANTGGELLIFSTPSKIDNYPKPKELE